MTIVNDADKAIGGVYELFDAGMKGENQMNNKARILVKAATHKIARRQRLRFAIKQACSMEKDAGAGQTAGRWIGRFGNMIARKGSSSPNFAQRLGSQLVDTGLRRTAKAGFRRFGEKMPLTHDLITDMYRRGRERGRSYVDALTGREARKFMKGRKGALMDMARPHLKDLAHGEAGRLQELTDLATLAADNTASDAVGRQAARIVRRQFRTRLGTAGVGTTALGYLLFGGRNRKREPARRPAFFEFGTW